MITFDKIVNKLLKKWWKVLWKEEIFKIIDPEQKSQYQKKVDNYIYRLKAEKIIFPIKSWVYIMPTADDRLLNEIDLIEKYFYPLVKKYISYYVWNQYCIIWQKSLEIHLKNYSISEKLYILTRNLDKKIKIWNKEIIFKTISGKSENKKINLFSKIYKNSQNKSFENIEIKVTSLEHAILETALMQENYGWVSVELLTQAIKKYSTILDDEIFKELGKYKYIMSFNRLKEISKSLDTDFSQLCLQIIKQNGWLFIWEWLRGM